MSASGDNTIRVPVVNTRLRPSMHSSRPIMTPAGVESDEPPCSRRGECLARYPECRTVSSNEALRMRDSRSRDFVLATAADAREDTSFINAQRGWEPST